MLQHFVFALSLLCSIPLAQAVPSARVVNIQNFTDESHTHSRRSFTPEDFAGSYTRFMELSRTGHLCPNRIQIGSNGKTTSSEVIKLPLDQYYLKKYHCSTNLNLRLKHAEKITSKILKNVFRMSPSSTGIEGILRGILEDIQGFYYGVVDTEVPCEKTSILQDTAIVFTSDRDAFASGLQLDGEGFPKFIFWHDFQKTCLYSGPWIDGEYQVDLSGDDDDMGMTAATPSPSGVEDTAATSVSASPQSSPNVNDEEHTPEVMSGDLSESPSPSKSALPESSPTAAGEEPTPSGTPQTSPSEQSHSTSSPSMSGGDVSITPSVSDTAGMIGPTEPMNPTVTPTALPASPTVTGSAIVSATPSTELPPPVPTMEATTEEPTPANTVMPTYTPVATRSNTFTPSPTELDKSPNPLTSEFMSPEPDATNIVTSTPHPSVATPSSNEATVHPTPTFTVESTPRELPSFTSTPTPISFEPSASPPYIGASPTSPIMETQSPVPMASSDLMSFGPTPAISVDSTHEPTESVTSTSTPTTGLQVSFTPMTSAELTSEPELTSTHLPSATEVPTTSPLVGEATIAPSSAPDLRESPDVTAVPTETLNASSNPQETLNASSNPQKPSSNPQETLNASSNPQKPMEETARASPEEELFATAETELEISPETILSPDLESPTTSPSTALSPNPSTDVTSGDDSGSACFPGDAVVTLSSGLKIRINRLKVGDVVDVADNAGSVVIAFTHYDPHIRTSFLRFTTDAGLVLHVSSGHYVYSSRGLVTGSHITENDMLQLRNGTMTRVLQKEHVVREGLFNPQTAQGDIVVDGFRVSTYTSVVQPMAAHALLAPVRFGGNLGANLVGYLADNSGVVSVARAVLGSHDTASYLTT